MSLLTSNPMERPNAEEALELKWLKDDNLEEYNQKFS